MERVCTMLSGGRIIRFLIVVLACVAVWKVWDYIGGGDSSATAVQSPQPVGPKSSASQNKDSSSFHVHQAPLESIKELEVEVQSRVVVQVFYEVLCPDSKSFVRYQLAPTMEKIGDRIELSLVPYGKATTYDNGGELSFKCQHGELECLGNKVHACVIEHIPDTALQTKIVSCMIADNRKPKTIAQKCIGKYSSTDYPRIQQCYTSREGDELLKHMGSMTHSLSPRLTYVPTVTLDGSQGNLWSVLQDLLGSVCKALKGDLPPACRSG